LTHGTRLDEWFGEHASVEIARFGEEDAYRFTAVLAGADEQGLVVSHYGGTDYLIQRHTFFPWQNVRWVQKAAEEQDQGEEKGIGPSLSGD
jgi:hypothetical protein